MLELLFSYNGIFNRNKLFKIKQTAKAVLFSKPLYKTLLMFINTTHEIAGNSDIKSWPLVTHNVDVVTLVHSPTGTTLPYRSM